MTLEQQIVLACQLAVKDVLQAQHLTVEQLLRIINATAELRGGYVGVLQHVMDRQRLAPGAVSSLLQDMEAARLEAHMRGEELGRCFAERAMP